ncbi:triple tyrosine motif-containing protein [Galbibacter mesophilus]|uniref:triple tyrosine motif-containing protein n=1 Tax=Galbibacter mesophilus TaxID=379069 RepID=UPI00191E3FE9|nr:triple tyrosine motif-containing protein [Galbibacter mesophilus]MCM5662293.1 LuxR C-terminal-related transcriptional regulator [Galbibacter mesophilus]
MNFPPSAYEGENQNWKISQNDHKFIYVANNAGMLEYNGSTWNLYRSPNSSVMRSVLAIGDRVYGGFYREFGYWQLQPNGKYKYQSVSSKLKESMFEDENIWNIKKIDQWVVFQSYDRLYLFNPNKEEITILTETNNFYRIYNLDNKLFLQKKDRNLYRVSNGETLLMATIEEKEEIGLIMNVFENQKGELIAVTRSKGLFKIKDGSFEKWNIKVSALIEKSQVFAGIQLKDGRIALGTIANGIFILNKQGEVLHEISRQDGLENNTVLALFQDVDGNLWTGLDNGISCLNMGSSTGEYFDSSGSLGTIYASVNFQGNLYLGTNQGLFYRKANSSEDFKLIPKTRGQVWSLFIYDDQLFCGHTSGTFIIENGLATRISNVQGNWNFRTIPNNPNKLLLGNYNGLSILEKQKDTWKSLGLIKGFDNSSRFFEIINSESGLQVWVSHEYKGVFKLIPNANFTRFKEVTLLDSTAMAKNSGLLFYNDKLLYSSEKGIFEIDTETNILRKSELNSLMESEKFLSGKMIADDENHLWMFSKENIIFSDASPASKSLVKKTIPFSQDSRKTTVSFENVSQISDNQFLIGGTNNYLIFDTSEFQRAPFKVHLNTVQSSDWEGKSTNYLHLNEKGLLDYKKGSVKFQFSVPNYTKYEKTFYQYKLEGSLNEWSEWETQPTVTFEKLPYGDYTFQVRAKIGNTISSNMETFDFTIKPPFYLSKMAIILYAALFILLVFATHYSYKNYYKNKQEKALLRKQQEIEYTKAQNEKEIAEIKNARLSEQVESKSRELAISTMSIVKRNEVLRNIKKELKKSLKLDKDHPVFQLIDKNLNGKEDWEFFEKAFNQADNEFFSKLKKKHPNLTNNDLKFCAFLRLNLSSKEIAPLLNISVKSVEVRRYRLRKKLELESDESLTDYIIAT